ncbi:hypothetical protein MK974_18790 [Burkholderia ambifaria]|uniref:hypothetical protein n=1 Tax=Burkholderia ambifaria TaxID=152480 RepID=UPI0022A907EF|nr:hypothetical protein [Burkholderia ambifaria]WAS57499.1 hypothetical protein MK974_18790 [Burkholderia ambifaria]
MKYIQIWIDRKNGTRLVQETYRDRQSEEALTYLYESDSFVLLARTVKWMPAATAWSFVDDPIAAANNAWDIAVGDRMEPVVVQMETGFMTFRIQKQVCRETPGGS